jgi:lysyl-tRNA synthetase class I
VPSGGDRLSDRINKLPKWARDYIHNVHTFVGAEEVQELTLLRDQQKQLLKVIAELKAENRRLKRKLHLEP